MQIAEWLKIQQIPRTVFARRIRVSKSYMTDLCNHGAWPGAKIMWRIIRATRGEVRPWDFLEASMQAARAKR